MQGQLETLSVIKFWIGAINPTRDMNLEYAMAAAGFQLQASLGRTYWSLELAEPRQLKTHMLEITE